MSEMAFTMVPTEITLDMQHAYFKVIDKNMDRVQTDCTFGRYRSQQEAYKEMLIAAPELSQTEIRKVQEEASRNFLDWLVDEIPEGKKVWPYEIQNKWIEYVHTQLRNPEKET